MPEGEPALPLRFQRPTLPETERIEAYLMRSRKARWFSNGGPCARLLSDRIAERVGAHCVPVASGTVGLLAAVAAVLPDRARRGGDALLPSFTFPATAQAAIWNGLRPRLLDADPDHWHLDPGALERELRHRGEEVAIVIAVSAFGTPPPANARERWERACAAADVPLIIDSAAGFGAVAEDGRPIGTQGDVEVVSFHATKPFAIGEGGAVLTRHDAIRERLELAINFGQAPDHTVVMPTALNGKLSELHSAVGLAVLDDFDAILETRRAAAARVRRGARPSLGWQFGCERSTWQFVPVRFEDGAARDEARARCTETVETRIYYQPLHRMRAMADAAVWDGSLEVTDDLSQRLLALPMANDLSVSELDMLAGVVGVRERRLETGFARTA